MALIGMWISAASRSKSSMLKMPPNGGVQACKRVVQLLAAWVEPTKSGVAAAPKAGGGAEAPS